MKGNLEIFKADFEVEYPFVLEDRFRYSKPLNVTHLGPN